MIDKTQKVFGIGLGKTGSKSLTAALNHLGIRAIHSPYSSKEKKKFIHDLGKFPALDHFQSIINDIGWDFEFLDLTYPNSKFILTTRNLESWMKSKELYAKDHDTRFEFTKEEQIEYYKSHYQSVMKYFENRLNDLLVMNIIEGDGWDKLCPFLGVRVPDAPFPKKNVRGDRLEWAKLSQELHGKIGRGIDFGSSFIFVDQNMFVGKMPGSRPFLESKEEFWGAPPDSSVALKECERMMQEGCDFIVFPWTSYWWFDHYTEFTEYIQQQFERVVEDDWAIIFDLRNIKEC